MISTILVIIKAKFGVNINKDKSKGIMLYRIKKSGFKVM